MKWQKEIKIKLFLLLTVILLSGIAFWHVHADTASSTVDQLNAQKSDTQKKLDQINQQIKDTQQQIQKIQATSNTLKNEIAIYDKQIASTELQIQAKQTQIEDTQTQIKELEKQIAQQNQELENNKNVLSQLLVELDQYDNDYLLKTTLGSNTLSEFLDQVQYTQNYQDRVYQLVEKIKDIKARLEKQQQDLKIQLANLQELQKQLQMTQEDLNNQRGQKQSLLNQTKGQERNYQKLLANSKQEEDKLQKEVDDLDAQIRAKLGNRSVNASHGILDWPMDGVLTQKYGNTGFTALGYNFHNGIDVAAPAATPLYAAADGVVLATDHNSDASYGNWVAIKHNLSGPKGPVNIITLYGHMRSFIVSPGQTVKQGDLIGYEGNTGNTTRKLYGPERGYHVHFGVYDQVGFGIANGAYTNIYGPYRVPYGYTYNPLDFLSAP
jgi:murein DD-endopeptidase MepM/ murein hydrolase activator NlpD